jgi:ABC-type cobalt transport system, ATPase component
MSGRVCRAVPGKDGISLRAENISFHYGAGKPVLEDFSADFTGGEITALTGKNGCGKTTLARIIMGILVPDGGSVKLGEEDLGALSLAERGARIGYVMQEPSRQLFSATVSEEIRFGLDNKVKKGLLTAEEALAGSEDAVKTFELERYRDEFPLSLSAGERQRVVLAAVMALRPSFLILDEPTSSLDKKRKTALYETLLRIKEENGCGTILITHDRAFAALAADREIVMPGGGRNV